MKYLGSKRRIAEDLLQVILPIAEQRNIKTWVEPFVGGGNIIDKVPSSFNRIGYDLNPHVIAALIDIRDHANELPDSVSEELYKSLRKLPADTITSWIRFICSFGGNFEEGYARDSKNRNYASVGKRNALKQSPLLQGVVLNISSYEDIIITEPSIIYCDPPYYGTRGYKTGGFNHEKFFNWCRQKAKEGHLIFISEYIAPDDFICIWEKRQTTHIDKKYTNAKKEIIEKLFVYSS